MDLIEQDTNTPADKSSNWYVLFRTKREKLFQTFNTTETITINRRIRFQQSTQQISTPANRRTHKRIDYRQIGVSNSNVQNNRIDYQQLAYRIPTSTQPATGASTSNCLRRQNRSTLIGPTSKHWWRPSVNPLLSTVTAGVDRPCFQLDAFVDHSVRTTSKTAWRNCVCVYVLFFDAPISRW